MQPRPVHAAAAAAAAQQPLPPPAAVRRSRSRSRRHRCAVSSSPSSPPSLAGVAVQTFVPKFVQQHQQHDQQQQQQPVVDVPPPERWRDDAFLMLGCEPRAPRPLRVAALVSGGVDSSVALRLVAAAGHQPTAFYLQIWFQEDFRNYWDACPWEEDLQYAKAVCDALNIELRVVPMTDEYWRRVVSESVSAIKAGRTPNPDVLCNSRVKFGAFAEWLERAHPGEFDRIASGHYAQLLRGDGGDGAGEGADAERRASHAAATTSSGSGSTASTTTAAARLALGPDAVKDQSYFLAALSPQQLQRCMFPLGHLTKPTVRALASAAQLATSGRKDSQGICFLGKVRFSEFVREHLGAWPGPLVDEATSSVLGAHDGYWFYTVGQRGGIKLPGGPWYVSAKDMSSNVVYVTRDAGDGAAGEAEVGASAGAAAGERLVRRQRRRRRDAFVCGPLHWLGPDRPQHEHEQPLMVKVRHGPHAYRCRLTLGGRREMLARLDGVAAGDAGAAADAAADGQQQQYGFVELEAPDQGLAAGQYAVFYQSGVCLGSAPMLGAAAPADGEDETRC